MEVKNLGKRGKSVNIKILILFMSKDINNMLVNMILD